MWQSPLNTEERVIGRPITMNGKTTKKEKPPMPRNTLLALVATGFGRSIKQTLQLLYLSITLFRVVVPAFLRFNQVVDLEHHAGEPIRNKG